MQEKPLHFQCKIYGNAAKLIIAKIKEQGDKAMEKNPKGRLPKYGKQRACQALLCELWELKKAMK